MQRTWNMSVGDMYISVTLVGWLWVRILVQAVTFFPHPPLTPTHLSHGVVGSVSSSLRWEEKLRSCVLQVCASLRSYSSGKALLWQNLWKFHPWVAWQLQLAFLGESDPNSHGIKSQLRQSTRLFFRYWRSSVSVSLCESFFFWTWSFSI